MKIYLILLCMLCALPTIGMNQSHKRSLNKPTEPFRKAPRHGEFTNMIITEQEINHHILQSMAYWGALFKNYPLSQVSGQ